MRGRRENKQERGEDEMGYGKGVGKGKVGEGTRLDVMAEWIQ